MVDKLHQYQGPVGRLHTIRDNIKESYSNWKENHGDFDKKLVNSVCRRSVEPNQNETDVDYDFSYIHKRKSRWELLRISAVIAGIEFTYSAITAFSSPILLEMGVHANFMSMVFSLSPLLGFFLTPVCGSLSDRCTLSFGRRRVFIIIFSLFELIGLFLIPYGYSQMEIFNENFITSRSGNFTDFTLSNDTAIDTKPTKSVSNSVPGWVIFVTIVGIVIADHCADACQNPSRAYLLDVCNEADHTRGLSTFTILAGCGGTIGYGLGAINWDTSFLSDVLGGHIKTVFTITSVLFAFCVIATVTSFKEVPLKFVNDVYEKSNQMLYRSRRSTIRESSGQVVTETYESVETNDFRKPSTSQFDVQSKIEEEQTLSAYLSSIVKLPYSLRILLLTNVLCWMSHVSYSLYFTDYVGEAIFRGDPKAPVYSIEREKYEEGVRFACRGMSVYSLSCMICSIFIERTIEKFGLKKVYMTNLAIDMVSMLLMFTFNSEETALIFSFAKGVLYCSIFTVPYIIVANYHTLNVFQVDSDGEYVQSTQIRGLGTDISIIGSSVFIAQFFLSFCMGFIISLYGSARAVPLIGAILSFFAVISASQVVYLNL